MRQNELRRINWLKMLIGIAVILVGAALFVYGGYDDSPGGQILGLVIVVFGFYNVIKACGRGRSLPKT